MMHVSMYDIEFMHQNFWEHHGIANGRQVHIFSQLASLVDRCRVEWKTHLKRSTLSIKKIAWDFQRSVSFHGSCPEEAKKGQHFMCKKFQRYSMNFILQLQSLSVNSPCPPSTTIKKYVILKNEFYFRPNLFAFLAVLHGKPVQQLHLYARKVDDNGALAVVQCANR